MDATRERELPRWLPPDDDQPFVAPETPDVSREAANSFDPQPWRVWVRGDDEEWYWTLRPDFSPEEWSERGPHRPALQDWIPIWTDNGEYDLAGWEIRRVAGFTDQYGEAGPS